MTTPEVVIIITTLTTGVVSTVNAIASGWGRQEVRAKAEEVKQTTKEAHQDIIDKVYEVSNGDIAHLSSKIDALSQRVGNIESWVISERTARTRSTDK